MDTNESSARRFEDFVEHLRVRKSSDRIATLLPWQGRVATAALLREAVDLARVNGKATVRLLTGTCPARVYDRLFIDAVRTLVAKKVRVQILVWDFPYNLPLASEPGIELRFAGMRSETNHFLVVDEVAYRHEEKHPYFPSNQVGEMEPPVSATVCFNDPEGAGTLVYMFDQLWESVRTKQKATPVKG